MLQSTTVTRAIAGLSQCYSAEQNPAQAAAMGGITAQGLFPLQLVEEHFAGAVLGEVSRSQRMMLWL